MGKTPGVVRGLVINDPHTSDQPPLGRLPTYREDIAAKLRECAEITRTEKLDLTIFTGDIFHQKRQNLVSHGLVQENADILRSFHGDRKGILGNHDLSFEGAASMSTQPIGSLAKTGAVDILLEDTIVEYGGLAVMLSPVVWTPDQDSDPDSFRLGPESALLARDADFVIRIAHGAIVPPGWGDVPFAVVQADQIDLTGIDLLLSGHLHPDYGVFDILQRHRDHEHVCHFANLGSLSRVSRTPDQLSREAIRVLGFNIIGPHQAEYTEYELSAAKPVADVFYQMGESEETPMELEDFAQRLAEFVVEEDDIERLLHDAERSGVTPEVMRIVLMRLEEVGYVPGGYGNAAEAASDAGEGDPDEGHPGRRDRAARGARAVRRPPRA
jgi:hypothetical protein